MAVNDDLLDRQLRHATFLERYKQSEVNAIRRTLNSGHRSALDELRGRLNRLSRKHFKANAAPESIRRVKQMIEAVDSLAQASLNSVRTELVDNLVKLSSIESRFALESVRSVFPVAYDFVSPPPQLLRSIVTSRPMDGELLNDWWEGIGRNRKRGVTAALNNGLTTGRSIPQISRDIRGVLNTTTRHATTIARTAVNHVSTHAREESYAENSDIIKKVQYVATLDSRTTDICMSLDGRVFLINEGPRPPMHHQCRSTTVPIVSAWNEIPGVDFSDVPDGTRASINGQVPAKQTYDEWLRRQPNSVQNEALGRARADLFRRGRITTRDLVDNGFKPLTLEQLKQLEGASN